MVRTLWLHLSTAWQHPIVFAHWYGLLAALTRHTWLWLRHGFRDYWRNVVRSRQTVALLARERLRGGPVRRGRTEPNSRLARERGRAGAEPPPGAPSTELREPPLVRLQDRRLVWLTLADTLKLLPFTLITLLPAGEALLPPIVRWFPAFLPSTFRAEPVADAAFLRRAAARAAAAAAALQRAVEARLERAARESGDAALAHNSRAVLGAMQSTYAGIPLRAPPSEEADAAEGCSESTPTLEQPSIPVVLTEGDLAVFASLAPLFRLDLLETAVLEQTCLLLGLPAARRAALAKALRRRLRELAAEDDEMWRWGGWAREWPHKQLRAHARRRGLPVGPDADPRKQLLTWLALRRRLRPLFLFYLQSYAHTHRVHFEIEPTRGATDHSQPRTEGTADSATPLRDTAPSVEQPSPIRNEAIAG